MRVFAQCAAVGSCAVAFAVSGPISAQTKDPAAILAAARQALGGEKKLTAVKSFTATGRTRQVRGDNLVPIEFEIFVELPDKYLRKDEIPAQESGPTASGFNGEEWLQDPPPAAPPAAARGPGAAAPGTPGAGAPGGTPAGRAESRRRARRHAQAGLRPPDARDVRGIVPDLSLTFTYVGEAEAPQGKADVLDAKGREQLHACGCSSTRHAPADHGELDAARPARPRADAAAGMPGHAAWRGARRGARRRRTRCAARSERGARRRCARGAATRGGAAGCAARRARRHRPPASAAAPARRTWRTARPAGAAAPGAARRSRPPPVENRLYFADYRDVDGMQFPFRLRRAVGADTIEETTFDRYRINAKIDPKKFEVRKPQIRTKR